MSVRDLLLRRRLAYIRTFYGDGSRPHPEAERVLEDLKRFCGINRGGIVVSPVTRSVDPYATHYRAGQRDVYLRIVKFLNLDETEIGDHSDRAER